MSVTKALNSKANIKQISSADFPVVPRQPVTASYTAESTAGQTVITFPFQIDTVNAPDSLILHVDGKTLSPGSSYDYQFAGVDAFGFTNTITLNSPIAALLNIRAIKMGLKKETEFLQDARFTAIYEAEDQAFQGFVRTSDLMLATSTTGTPSPGTFYSSIVNRSSIPDLSKDLKSRMGIDRITTQNAFVIQNEFGPNGELVFGLLNDDRNQVRFVGQSILVQNSNSGSRVIVTAAKQDYAEITFFGTGLNILGELYAALDLRVTVDGGTEGASSILAVTPAASLSGRGYAPNHVIPAVSGLAQGVHTVRLRMFGVNDFGIGGFEILNETSTIKVQPGSSYLAGKKLTNIAQQSLAYNAVATGTKGGRVVVYQKSDGTIAQAWNAVSASQLNLSAADHTNEEVVRPYYFREFGVGRSDDFSTTASASGSRAFTLDDGTTTLVTTGIDLANEGIIPNAAGNWIAFTFVGTGLDFTNVRGAAIGSTYTITVDGIAVGTGLTGSSFGANGIGNVKIVSGLPYGTHVFKITCTTLSGAGIAIGHFTVYQPKKPSIPTGSVELSDFNLMANFVANTTANLDTMSTGTLRKDKTREVIYTGTGINVAMSPSNSIGGFTMDDSVVGDTTSLTFFGTGFDMRYLGNTDGGTTTVMMDGLTANSTNFPSASFSAYGGTTSYSNSTGVLNQNSATTPGCGLIMSGLSLGLHTVKFTHTSGPQMRINAIDVITPTHSVRSNIYGDFQNSLPVGSQCISDNRKTSAIKDSLPTTKAWAQAVAITANVSTSSTTYVPLQDLSVVIKTTGGPLKITWNASILNTGGNGTRTVAFVDGVQVGNESTVNQTNYSSVSNSVIIPVSPGYHKVDIYWRVDASTGSAGGDSARRTLVVEEK
jgi:hypothetical protein